jgi:DNA-binding transcriptional LysR family regulator
VGNSAELLELMQAGQLDVVLCMSSQDDPGAVRTAPMLWLGRDDLARQKVIPLAVLERPCRFRDAALAALDKCGRPWRIVLETPSLAALRAAVDSGLGITCRTTHFMDNVISAQEALPSLPHVAYVRHIRSNPHPTISRLADLIQTAALEL